MNKKKIFRHIIGYTLGIPVFAFLIPLVLYKLSSIFDPYIKISMIDNLNLRIIVSLPILIIGLFFVIWSNIALFRIGKGGPADGFNIAISPRTEKLVIAGPYRYTRNPMVFGAFATYFSIGIYLNSLICLMVLILSLFLAIKYLKLTEEKRLYKDFGDEFLEYKKNVPMIIPFTRRLK